MAEHIAMDCDIIRRAFYNKSDSMEAIMICKKCGYENEDGAKFCSRCGEPFDAEGENVSEAYQPISMWGYFGYELLFNIPVAGFILLIVFSFGGTKNINLRNFARSYFCFIIIVAILLVIFFGAILGAVGASTASNAFGAL